MTRQPRSKAAHKNNPPNGTINSAQPASAPPGSPVAPPEPITELGKMLGADDPAIQCQIVQRLIQPHITLVIHYNPAQGIVELSTIGPQVTVKGFQHILHLANQEVTNMALQQAAQQAAQQAREQAVTPPAQPSDLREPEGDAGHALEENEETHEQEHAPVLLPAAPVASA